MGAQPHFIFAAREQARTHHSQVLDNEFGDALEAMLIRRVALD
jgi:hypothetical protein